MKEQSGITLVSLIIAVIIIIIISSISFYQGKEAIKNAKIQTFEANMLTIKAKAKAYGEEIDAAIWALSDTKKEEKKNELLSTYGMSEVNIDNNIIEQLDSNISDKFEAYEISGMLEKNGLSDIKEDTDGDYVVIFDSEDYTNMDVAYTEGVSYNGYIYYTLSALQEANEGY